ncbi:hypothetical protein [Pararhizobium gei]|uniref:hypothetical protein n=1 Tax=Pararhizobium gei TaxID=1395951 RepID=UPI0023DA5BFE|nr:hypothetical protein [Rhizobium gei]
MMNDDHYKHVLCADDIAALRDAFELFCREHHKLRCDADMEASADLMIRLYRNGERNPDALRQACEASLDYRNVA